jgi:hypothetical protein
MVASTPGPRHLGGSMVSSFKQEDTMQYLKDLIERFGKALRIKSPNTTREPVSTNHLGPVQGPVRDPR